MRKYRVEVRGHRITVQKRFLWVFWSTEQDYSNYAGSDDKLFTTIEEAFEYIEEQIRKANVKTEIYS